MVRCEGYDWKSELQRALSLSQAIRVPAVTIFCPKTGGNIFGRTVWWELGPGSFAEVLPVVPSSDVEQTSKPIATIRMVACSRLPCRLPPILYAFNSALDPLSLAPCFFFLHDHKVTQMSMMV